MNKALVPILVVLVAAAGAFLMLGGDNAEGPRPMGPQDEPAVEDQTPPEELRSNERQTTRVAETDRSEVTDSGTGTGAEFEQGVFGQVLAPTRAPAPGVRVYLFEGHGANLFAAMMQQANGVVKKPLAQTETDDNGEYRLGVQTIAKDKNYELRFVSDQYSDKTRPQLTLFEGRWFDAGALQLDRGCSVYGRVSDEDGRAIADAQVFAKASTPQFVFAPTPGREQGIEAVTDQAGYYRFDNVPPGVVSLAAVAPGFARVEHTNLTIKVAEETNFDFQLPVGQLVRGVVTNEDGEMVPDAKLTISSISAKTRVQIVTRSDAEGRFEAIGLVDGLYQMTVVAAGYVQKDVRPIEAGSTNEVVVLERQGSARLRVVTKAGRRMNRYDVVLKNWFEEQGQHGNIPGMAAHKVFERDLASDGTYVFSGLNPGTYAFEVHATKFAKAFSEPFTIAAGGPEPSVTVEMSEGGTIRATVLAHDGTPLQGVTVTTLPNDIQDTQILGFFGPMIPYNITKTGRRTKGNGKFSMNMLTPGTYQLKFDHPDHYAVYVKDIEVQEGQVSQLGEVQMDQGTLIFGTARVDGRPAAQVKITVHSMPGADGKNNNPFSATVVTAEDGTFTLPKRLPPGNYQASAGRQGGSPFNLVVDYSKTKREFAVQPGLPEHQIHFDIASN